MATKEAPKIMNMLMATRTMEVQMKDFPMVSRV